MSAEKIPGRSTRIGLLSTPLAHRLGFKDAAPAMGKSDFDFFTPMPSDERRMAMQHEITRALAESECLPDALERMLRIICTDLSWDLGVVRFLQMDWQVLTCELAWVAPESGLSGLVAQVQETALARGQGLPGRVWEIGKPLWISDCTTKTSALGRIGVIEAGCRSALCVPILLGNQFLGTLEFFSLAQQKIDQELLQILMVIGNQIGQFAERKKAEETRNRLVAILEATPDYVSIASPLSERLYLNRAGRKMLGIPKDAIIDLIGDRDCYPDWAKQIIEKEAIPTAIRDGLWRGETAILSGDGRVIPVSQVIVCHRSATGSVEFFSTIVRDISERKRAELELEKAVIAADAANQAKGNFLANMSHEIRTPMNGIIGMTELALGTDLTPEQRQYLKIVKASADSLLRVLNDILDFSKIEAGKLDINPEPFGLRGVIGDALQTLSVRANEKKLELACQVQPDVPDRLVGDSLRLRQVILNLVGNAIKFTSAGEVDVRVFNEDTSDGNLRLHFAIRDTGPGIPDGKQEALFKPFTQADTSTTRQYGGTGLGLAISSQLVALMGGKIWVESEVGNGSTFHFTAKFFPSGTGGQIDQTPVPAESQPNKLTGNLRILLAEDNEVNQELAVAILKKRGHHVQVANNGREVLDALEREPFDVVLMDVQMPELDGIQATMAIRKAEKQTDKHIPIVAMTAHAMKGDRERCLAAGMDAYVSKPLRSSELIETISGALAMRSRPCFPAFLGERRNDH
jgi:PAS domain S-box-containing protein